MIICKNCRETLSDGDLYCSRCGTGVVKQTSGNKNRNIIICVTSVLFALLLSIFVILGLSRHTYENGSGSISSKNNQSGKSSENTGNTDNVSITMPSVPITETSAINELKKNSERKFAAIIYELENGSYENAKDLYNNDVMGNIQVEQSAAEFFEAYGAALWEDLNNGLITYDEIELIERSAQLAGFDTSYQFGHMQFEYLRMLNQSKERFVQGVKFYNENNHINALEYLKLVIAGDRNFEEAIRLVMSCSEILIDIGGLDNLQQVVNALEIHLAPHSEYANYGLSIYEIEYLPSGYANLLVTAKLAFAQELDVNYMYRYAIQQYAQLILDYNETGYTQQRWGELMRLVNSRYYGHYGSFSNYYDISPEGAVTGAEDAKWSIGTNNVYQLSICDFETLYGGYNSLLFLIKDLRTVSVSKDDFAKSDQLSLNIAAEIEATEGITKICGIDRFGAVALMYDGTVRVFGINTSFDDLLSWRDVIDIHFRRDGIIGLTSTGRVLVSRRDAGVDGAGLDSWENVVSLKFTDDYPRYSVSGLLSDGTVRYSDNYTRDTGPITGIRSVDDEEFDILWGEIKTKSYSLGLSSDYIIRR